MAAHGVHRLRANQAARWLDSDTESVAKAKLREKAREEAKGEARGKKHKTRTHALAVLQRTAKDLHRLTRQEPLGSGWTP